jgi:hypothetical protein
MSCYVGTVVSCIHSQWSVLWFLLHGLVQQTWTPLKEDRNVVVVVGQQIAKFNWSNCHGGAALHRHHTPVPLVTLTSHAQAQLQAFQARCRCDTSTDYGLKPNSFSTARLHGLKPNPVDHLLHPTPQPDQPLPHCGKRLGTPLLTSMKKVSVHLRQERNPAVVSFC